MTAQHCGDIFEKLGLEKDATAIQIVVRLVNRMNTTDALVEALEAIEQRGRDAGRREVWEQMRWACIAFGESDFYCGRISRVCEIDSCPLLGVK